jgi:hypothetical protein
VWHLVFEKGITPCAQHGFVAVTGKIPVFVKPVAGGIGA